MATGTKGIFDSFQKAVEGVSRVAAGSPIAFSGLSDSIKAYLLSKSFLKNPKNTIVLLSDNEKAAEFYGDLVFFLGKTSVVFYPSSELLPFEDDEPHPDIESARIEALYSLAVQQAPVIMVTSVENALEKIIPKDEIIKRVVTLKKGSEIEREELLTTLQSLGYERKTLVEERGEMSVRGGIVDVFPPGSEEAGRYPVRIEFFGDEVESIRTFDPVTQRSRKEFTEVRILPVKPFDLSAEGRLRARENLLERVEEFSIERKAWDELYNALRDNEKTILPQYLLRLFFDSPCTLQDYLPEAAVVKIGAQAIDSSVDVYLAEANERIRNARFIKEGEAFLLKHEFEQSLAKRPVVELNAIGEQGAQIKYETNLSLRQDIAIRKDLSPLREKLASLNERGIAACVVAHNKGQAERMRELLEGVRSIVAEGFPSSISSNAVTVCIGAVSSGFTIEEEKICLISEEEIFGERVKRRPPPKKKLEAFLNEMRDLNEGDFVVHTLHGIGIYRGMKRTSTDGVDTDFLLLEYRDGDKLYVPVHTLDRVSKYHGAEGGSVEIDKLGGKGWLKKTARAKRAVAEIAGELIKLYALRKSAKGFAFSQPAHMYEEFEAGFEFDETPDQERAINDVMDDMGRDMPMDRLICGDVGYGKTEVAMRAAFRAVTDNKQVAVLVPTTVLAQQHFATFKKRFAPFPVTIEVLSRFRSKAEQESTVKAVAEGKVDIVIGTHRLLQKDVVYKNLGLIVVDEEHRFGVRHKERLKELKKSVDALTLTATPIPRTLHMAIGGIRELSVINTPPEDRLSISTRLIRFDDNVIKEAIERELKRGGQVFFVHNRVETIASIKTRLDKICSTIKDGIRIAVGHGQMRESELEKIMLGFVSKDYDILLSTTIIESGLDIPSANTIIIDRADHFGLAELYQLRGRVGRSSHRAYAYFICPDATAMTPDAVKRMEVINEMTELGAGFRIAAYDLEIRGAGEVLGSAQSGRVAEVGFDFYTELLEEAVAELKGEKAMEEESIEVRLNVSQYVSEDYVPDPKERLNFYKRLAMIGDEDSLFAFMEEVEDRYGKFPVEAENLFQVKRIAVELRKMHATELLQKGGRLYVAFDKDLTGKSPGLSERIMRLIKERGDKYRLTPDSKLSVLMGVNADPLSEARYLLKELLEG